MYENSVVELLDYWDIYQDQSEQGARINIEVCILDTKNGNIKFVKDWIPFWVVYSKPDVYMWEEGNYECDCNRYFLMYGEDECPCGSERFQVNLINPKDNRTFYREF